MFWGLYYGSINVCTEFQPERVIVFEMNKIMKNPNMAPARITLAIFRYEYDSLVSFYPRNNL